MTERLLATSLERVARAHVDRVALRDEKTALSHGQLLAHAAGVAQHLRGRGLAEDEPVMVKVANHPLDFAVFLGVWQAGGVVVPVHRTAPPGVVDAIQAKADCRFAIDLPALPEGARDQAGTGHDDDAALAHAIVPLPSDASDRDEAARLLRGAALVIFTSGSTGLPKGVVLSHEAFHGKLQQNQRLLRLGADDVTLLVLNNTFSYGIWLALVTLLQGGTVVTRSRFTPAGFLDTLVEERITRVGVVPTMIRATFGALDEATIAQARERLCATGTLRDMVIGGEPLGPDLSMRLRALIAPAGLYDIYGLTETSTSDFVLMPATYADHRGTIGQAAPGVRARVVDDDGALCAPGMPGELQLKTPFIMAGYLRDPALTQAAFVDGWFRTGDQAALDAAGFATIVGRLKELIVRGGNKITPIEVERALCACEGVGAAMVIGLPDAVMGQRIVALLVPQAQARLSAADLRRQLADTLERFKHPDACYVGTELPTGRTGKIDRGQLKALLAAAALPLLPAWAA